MSCKNGNYPSFISFSILHHRSRLTALESTVEGKDQQYAELNQKYLRLSEDFKYNLKLIDDRDKELATFDNRYKGILLPFDHSFLIINLFRNEENFK